jgi:hypothetical protein
MLRNFGADACDDNDVFHFGWRLVIPFRHGDGVRIAAYKSLLM